MIFRVLKDVFEHKVNRWYRAASRDYSPDIPIRFVPERSPSDKILLKRIQSAEQVVISRVSGRKTVDQCGADNMIAVGAGALGERQICHLFRLDHLAGLRRLGFEHGSLSLDGDRLAPPRQPAE